MFAICYVDAMQRMHAMLFLFVPALSREIRASARMNRYLRPHLADMPVVCFTARRANAKVISLKSCAPRVASTNLRLHYRRRVCFSMVTKLARNFRNETRPKKMKLPHFAVDPSCPSPSKPTSRWRFRKHESTTARALLSDSITLGNVQGLFFSPISPRDGACSGLPSSTCIAAARLFFAALFLPPFPITLPFKVPCKPPIKSTSFINKYILPQYVRQYLSINF